MKTKILVSGSVAYDQIMNFPGRFRDNILPEKIHVLNVSFFIKQLQEGFGGTAGNIAYNLSLLGERPVILARAGADFGRYATWLKSHRLDISQIQIDRNEKTAAAYIITDQDDNQIAGFYPGAAKIPYHFKSDFKLKNCWAIVAPDNPVNMANFVRLYQNKKIPYIFDLGQQVASLTRQQLRPAIRGAKVFIANDYELSLTLKKTGWSLATLQKQVEILVVTLGVGGSRIYQAGRQLKIPAAKPKNTVDPTGAGDAYRAGLLYGLIKAWPLEKAGRLASLVAVYTVEKYGTQTHYFNWPNLKRRYRQNFGQPL